MAYDEKYRVRAVSYKDSGHTFKELKETFKITSWAYYQWKKNKEKTGFYVPPKAQKATRNRKIDSEKLLLIIEERPDAYLRELAKNFNCSVTAVHNRLKQLDITLKKSSSHI